MQSIFMKYQYVYEVGGHTVEDRKQNLNFQYVNKPSFRMEVFLSLLSTKKSKKY